MEIESLLEGITGLFCNFEWVTLTYHPTVHHTWLFLEEFFLQINAEPQVMLRREQDGYLMEQFYDSQPKERQLLTDVDCTTRY